MMHRSLLGGLTNKQEKKKQPGKRTGLKINEKAKQENLELSLQ